MIARPSRGALPQRRRAVVYRIIQRIVRPDSERVEVVNAATERRADSDMAGIATRYIFP